MRVVAPKLSICTPTHEGRAGTLAFGLERLLGQVTGAIATQVEVCISDNASMDGTEDAVARLAARSPIPIHYRRNPVDLGAGRNILQSVEMARGDYCWLVSSDDALAPGALARMLELLAQHPDIGGASVAYEAFDPALERPLPTPRDRMPRGDRARVIEGLKPIVEEIGPYYAGISVHVVKRRAWLAAVDLHRSSPLVDGLFPFVVFLVGAAATTPCWLWCPEPLIQWRSRSTPFPDMDGLMAGMLDDLAASLLAYLDSRDPVYRRVIARFAVLNVSSRAVRDIATHPTHTLRGRAHLIRVLLRRLYWHPSFWYSIAPSTLLPGLPIRAARRLRKELTGRRV
jgi:glycosyltransferase involved in cell wall biosynthesis